MLLEDMILMCCAIYQRWLQCHVGCCMKLCSPTASYISLVLSLEANHCSISFQLRLLSCPLSTTPHNYITVIVHWGYLALVQGTCQLHKCNRETCSIVGWSYSVHRALDGGYSHAILGFFDFGKNYGLIPLISSTMCSLLQKESCSGRRSLNPPMEEDFLHRWKGLWSMDIFYYK